MGLIQAVDFQTVQNNPALRTISRNEGGSRQHLLRRIGAFELIDGQYVGHIATLNFRCRAIIKDNPYRKAKADPEYVVEQEGGEAFYPELGFAWEKKTDGQCYSYLSVHLDDPAFPKTITAILVRGQAGFYHLYWDRISITDSDIEDLFVTEELYPYVDVHRPVSRMTEYLAEIYPLLADQWGYEPD